MGTKHNLYKCKVETSARVKLQVSGRGTSTQIALWVLKKTSWIISTTDMPNKCHAISRPWTPFHGNLSLPNGSYLHLLTANQYKNFSSSYQLLAEPGERPAPGERPPNFKPSRPFSNWSIITKQPCTRTRNSIYRVSQKSGTAGFQYLAS